MQTILDDRKSIQPVSVRLHGEYGLRDVCVSVPARIGMHGVEDVIELPLTAEEQAALEKSAGVMRQQIESLELPR